MARNVLGDEENTEEQQPETTGDEGGGRVGHNSKERLRSFIERVERLREEKAAIQEDEKEVFAEAKGEGWDVKTLRKVIQLRKMDKADRQEQEALLALYLEALGEK